MLWTILISTFDSLDKINEFLQRQNLLKLTHVEIDELNWPIYVIDTESKINKHPKQKATSSGNADKTLRKKLYQFSMIFHWTEEGVILSNSFFEINIKVIPIPDRYIIRKKNNDKKYRPISFINIDAKILNKILAIWIQQYIKELYSTTMIFLSYKDLVHI